MIFYNPRFGIFFCALGFVISFWVVWYKLNIIYLWIISLCSAFNFICQTSHSCLKKYHWIISCQLIIIYFSLCTIAIHYYKRNFILGTVSFIYFISDIFIVVFTCLVFYLILSFVHCGAFCQSNYLQRID